jgi:hypothetical protein
MKTVVDWWLRLKGPPDEDGGSEGCQLPEWYSVGWGWDSWLVGKYALQRRHVWKTLSELNFLLGYILKLVAGNDALEDIVTLNAVDRFNLVAEAFLVKERDAQICWTTVILGVRRRLRADRAGWLLIHWCWLVYLWCWYLFAVLVFICVFLVLFVVLVSLFVFGCRLIVNLFGFIILF